MFAGTIIHEAIENYYNRNFDSVDAAVRTILPKTLLEKGLSKQQVQQLGKAIQVERRLMARFASGEICKPSGEKYTNPHMTAAYKVLAQSQGLTVMQQELASVSFDGIRFKSGGITEVASRILDLCSKYDATLRIDRDHLEWVKQEEGFDFVDTAPDGSLVRFLGYIDLVAKVKPEYRNQYNNKTYILIDYKTGAAHEAEEHFQSAHESMQLSLYQHVATHRKDWGIDPNDLFIALHYIDAALVAATERSADDYELLKALVPAFNRNKDNPGMVKRLFYDGRECQDCELRGACIKHFGMPTCKTGGVVVK